MQSPAAHGRRSVVRSQKHLLTKETRPPSFHSGTDNLFKSKSDDAPGISSHIRAVSADTTMDRSPRKSLHVQDNIGNRPHPIEPEVNFLQPERGVGTKMQHQHKNDGGGSGQFGLSDGKTTSLGLVNRKDEFLARVASQRSIEAPSTEALRMLNVTNGKSAEHENERSLPSWMRRRSHLHSRGSLASRRAALESRFARTAASASWLDTVKTGIDLEATAKAFNWKVDSGFQDTVHQNGTTNQNKLITKVDIFEVLHSATLDRIAKTMSVTEQGKQMDLPNFVDLIARALPKRWLAARNGIAVVAAIVEMHSRAKSSIGHDPSWGDFTYFLVEAWMIRSKTWGQAAKSSSDVDDFVSDSVALSEFRFQLDTMRCFPGVAGISLPISIFVEKGMQFVHVSRQSLDTIGSKDKFLSSERLMNSDGPVIDVAASPQMGIVFIAAKRISIWDLSTSIGPGAINHAPIRRLWHRDSVTCLSWHQPSKTLVSGHSDGSIMMWQSQAGDVHDDGNNQSAADQVMSGSMMTPNSTKGIQYTVHGTGGSRSWAQHLAVTNKYDVHGQPVTAIVLARPLQKAGVYDTNRKSASKGTESWCIISASMEGSISVWDVISERQMRRFDINKAVIQEDEKGRNYASNFASNSRGVKGVYMLSWESSSRTILACRTDHSASIFSIDSTSNTPLADLQHPSVIKSACPVEGKSLHCTLDSHQSIRIWNHQGALTQQLHCDPQSLTLGESLCHVFCIKHTIFAVSNRMHRFIMKSTAIRQLGKTHRYPVISSVFSNSVNKILVLGGNECQIFDAASGKQIWLKYLKINSDNASTMQEKSAPSGATSSPGGQTKGSLRMSKDYDAACQALDLEARRVFVGELNGSIIVLSIETGNILSVWQAHTDEVSAILLVRDFRWLISASLDGTINCYDNPGVIEKSRTVMKNCRGPITALGYSELHKLVISGTSTGFVCINSLPEGAILSSVAPFTNPVNLIQVVTTTKYSKPHHRSTSVSRSAKSVLLQQLQLQSTGDPMMRASIRNLSSTLWEEDTQKAGFVLAFCSDDLGHLKLLTVSDGELDEIFGCVPSESISQYEKDIGIARAVDKSDGNNGGDWVPVPVSACVVLDEDTILWGDDVGRVYRSNLSQLWENIEKDWKGQPVNWVKYNERPNAVFEEIPEDSSHEEFWEDEDEFDDGFDVGGTFLTNISAERPQHGQEQNFVPEDKLKGDAKDTTTKSRFQKPPPLMLSKLAGSASQSVSDFVNDIEGYTKLPKQNPVLTRTGETLRTEKAITFNGDPKTRQVSVQIATAGLTPRRAKLIKKPSMYINSMENSDGINNDRTNANDSQTMEKSQSTSPGFVRRPSKLCLKPSTFGQAKTPSSVSQDENNIRIWNLLKDQSYGLVHDGTVSQLTLLTSDFFISSGLDGNVVSHSISKGEMLANLGVEYQGQSEWKIDIHEALEQHEKRIKTMAEQVTKTVDAQQQYAKLRQSQLEFSMQSPPTTSGTEVSTATSHAHVDLESHFRGQGTLRPKNKSSRYDPGPRTHR